MRESSCVPNNGADGDYESESECSDVIELEETMREQEDVIKTLEGEMRQLTECKKINEVRMESKPT